MSTPVDWTPTSPDEKRVLNHPGTWHNPSGLLIRPIHTDVWVIERGYCIIGMDIGGKATIIRLSDNRLFIHSPVKLSPELKDEVDKLGTVSAVVAPNAYHMGFIAQWKKYYPNATFIAPVGTKEQKADVPFDQELGADNVADASYADDSLIQLHLPCAPGMAETVFFHKPSKTLVVTDLIMPYPKEGVPWMTRLKHSVMVAAFNNIYKFIVLKNRGALDECLEKIEGWEFETLIPTHGQVLMKDDKPMEVLKNWFNRH